MKLILHIGTAKTGTTSIQDFILKHRKMLLEDGILVPFSLFDDVGKKIIGNHRYFPYFAHNAGHKDEFWHKMNGDAASKRQRIINKKEQFICECKDASEKCDAVLISSEHLSSRLKRPEEIQRLHAFCSDIFGEIEIVLYLRDPLSASISTLSESLKAGGIWARDELCKAKDFKFGDYASLLSKWKTSFPGASFRVRKFGKKYLSDGDVVRDFVFHCLPNITKENYVLSSNISNLGLSLTGMALLSRLNPEFPPLIDGKRNKLRGNLGKFVADHTRDGSKFTPSKDEWKDYRDFFSEVNSSICRDFFQEDEFLFGDDFSEYAVERINLKKVEINPEVYERIISLLWRQKTLDL